ncbi:hypothetical protein ACEWX3_21280 [Mycobacterium sp. G7A2]|uniref:hypothetical protein n=1 Tax=Mycobacterium sp. G7A2 TaxID=3317307 RepID=UPI0035A98327
MGGLAGTKPLQDTDQRRVHLLMSLLGAALFAFGFAVPLEKGSTYLLWTGCCVLFSIYTASMLLMHRMFLFAALAVFLTYGVVTVWVSNFVLELPMSSWRVGWGARADFPEALGQSIFYLTFFGILANLAISQAPSYPTGRFTPDQAARYQVPVLGLTILSAGALVAVAGTTARDEYLLTADVESMFLVQASSIMLSALFAYAMFFVPAGGYRRLILLTLVGAALLVTLNGFRFLIVIFAFIWLFHTLSTRKLPIRRVVAVSTAAAVAYLFLLCLAYTRSVGMTSGEALDFLLAPDLNAALAYMGAADQVNIIAQDYYARRIDTGEALSGRTYLDAFLRLAPNFVHTSLFDTIRSQDYIVANGSFVPEVFRRNNWTIGSHLFVEAIINFGKYGPYLVLTVFAALMTSLDRLARRSPGLFLGYVVMSAMGYSLAWYGFGNFLKQSMFAFVCCAIIVVICRQSKQQFVAEAQPHTMR